MPGLLALLFALALLRVGTFAIGEIVESTTKAKADFTGRFDGTLPISMWIVALPVLGFVALRLPLHGAAVALVALAVPVLLPWPTVRWLLIPLGSARLAYGWTRLSTVYWDRDRGGGALFAAAWAWLRGGRSADDAAWIDARLDVDRPLTPGAVAASGLLAHGRGDATEARAMLRALELFDDACTARVLLRSARDYRAAEAAARGDWSEVLDLEAHPGPAPTQGMRLLAALGRRVLGTDDAPTESDLWGLYWTAPRLWRPARSWVQTSAAPDGVELPQAPHPTGDRLSDALAAHLSLLGRTRLEHGDLVAASALWQHALDDSAVRERVCARGAELRARTDTDPLEDLVHTAARDLAALARRHDLQLAPADHPGPLERAAWILREELLHAGEVAAQALSSRLSRGQQLAPRDELRDFLALRAIYEEGARLGGPEVRRTLFRPVYAPLCDLSVRLFNDRGQPWLSHAITRWLLGEALAVGDARAADLQTRNLRVTSK